MTEETPTTTSLPAKAEPSPAASSTDDIKAPRVWPLWIALLVLLIALVLGGGWFWLQMQAWQSHLNTALEKNSASAELITEAGKRYETKLGQLDGTIERQATQINDLRNQLDQIAKRVLTVGETGRTDWLLAEAEYLLRLANQRLHMERDYIGSLGILRAADEVLAETKEVAVYPVRKSLASEIARLEAVADVDRQGIYLRIEAMIEQIESLDQRLFFREAPMLNQAESEEPPKPEHWYDRAINAIKSLDRYFVIRYTEDPIEPLLAPEQIYYLRQNLRLMLEQAELALLDKDQKVYEQSLSKAESWVKNYFITNSPVTKAMTRNLQELREHDIDPALPDISESLRLLKGLMESVYRRSGPAPAQDNGEAS